MTIRKVERMVRQEQGKIVRWYPDRGFGFVTPDGGRSEDVFVHAKTLRQCHIDEGDIDVGTVLRFERGVGKGGKPEVVNLQLV